jgi:hypothetical protein
MILFPPFGYELVVAVDDLILSFVLSFEIVLGQKRGRKGANKLANI